MSKDIPPHKQDLVRTLINNKKLSPEEKWRAVIDLIRNCEEKKVVIYDKRVPVETAKDKKRPPREGGALLPAPEISAPTETSYYIDELYRKYRHGGLFRRKYLVRRPNRFGIGTRKRLIPTKKLVKLIELLAVSQNLVLSRLDAVMREILFDDSAEDPTVFNYLRLIRLWMTEAPLLHEPYDAVKWMERDNFDHAFRSLITYFYSFLKLGADAREKILAEVENRLRSLDVLKKEAANDEDPDMNRKEKDKRNLDREERIYEYLMTIRSFLPVDARQECLLAKRLKRYYDFNNLSELFLVIEEALVFQRPLTVEELVAYFRIRAPIVSQTAWDAAEDLLKKAGKDPESLELKKRESLRKELDPYETLYMLLRYEGPGHDLLLRAYADQVHYMDRKQYDPKIMYNDHHIDFIHGLVHYFKNMYVPLLDGSTVVFRDMGREEHSGSIFSQDYFVEQLKSFKSVAEEMELFINNNPALELTGDRLIRSVGDCFYGIGKELRHVFDAHRRWYSLLTRTADSEMTRVPITAREPDDRGGRGRPIPYYDCVIKELKSGTLLANELIGKRILEDNLFDGVFVRMNAFAYQVASDCSNENLLHDLDEMKSIMQRIEQSRR